MNFNSKIKNRTRELSLNGSPPKKPLPKLPNRPRSGVKDIDKFDKRNSVPNFKTLTSLKASYSLNNLPDACNSNISY